MSTVFCLLALAASANSSSPSENLFAPPNESYRLMSRGYGPIGTVRVKRPTFSWVVMPQDGAKVTETVITLNGRTVPTTYDSERGVVAYTPPTALPLGEYKVQVQVEVARRVRFKKEWSATVPLDALDRLPVPDEGQLSVFRALNAQRIAMGLQTFTIDPALCAAADSHAEYLSENAVTGHVQDAAAKGFTGVRPSDRTFAYGFCGGTWEAAGYEIEDPQKAFDAIFDAPYHRIPFLQPGTVRVGIGVSKRGTVIDGEMLYSKGSVVSPGDGQTGIPTSWSAYERPDPLRHFPELQRPTGYPIVLADFGGEGKLDVSSAQLTYEGKEVKAYLITPAMDESLTDAAFLIPGSPLGRGRRYEVQFNAHRGTRDVSRRWSFTTAP